MHNNLTPYLKSPLTHWQSAVNGEWETATALNASASKEQKQGFINQIATAPQDVAVEAFFKADDDALFFFGLRLEKLSKEQQAFFVRHLVTKASNTATFEDIHTIAAQLLDSEAIMNTRPNFLEVGIEGSWKSSGFMRVWNDGERHSASIQKIQSEAPHLLGDFSRAIMMEAAWDKPLPMWFALPISEIKNNRHHFSQDKYEDTSSGWVAPDHS